MELQQAISKRISIRKFKSDDVDDKKIIELVEAARLSPSAKNRQPWEFWVVRGGDKDRIADMMIDGYNKNPEKIKMDGGTSVCSTALVIKQVPVLILVFKTEDNQFPRSDTLSIGSAIEHILLRATELGLGSLWICDTWWVKEQISGLMKTKNELYSAIAIGYADENPSARPRKPIKDILKFVE